MDSKKENHLDRFISKETVRFMMGGMSNSQLYSLIKNGRFPKGIKIGSNSVRWLLSDVQEHMAGLVAKNRSLQVGQEGGRS